MNGLEHEHPKRKPCSAGRVQLWLVFGLNARAASPSGRSWKYPWRTRFAHRGEGRRI